MRFKKSIIVQFLLFLISVSAISCNLAKDSETEELRKEIADLKKEKDEQKTSKTEENKESENTEESKTKPKTKPKTKSLPITRDDAGDLMVKWEEAQDNADFNTYKSCYSPQFVGIKLTTSGKKTRMNYRQWMNDRQPMLKNIIDVGVQSLKIDIDGNTAVAQFEQTFQSANYQDSGGKVIEIKMFPDGAKIVSEEMTSSN